MNAVGMSAGRANRRVGVKERKTRGGSMREIKAAVSRATARLAYREMERESNVVVTRIRKEGAQ